MDSPADTSDGDSIDISRSQGGSGSTPKLKKPKKNKVSLDNIQLSDELVKDIIFGMKEAFEHRAKEYDPACGDYEITPQDYEDSKQLLLHRIPSQLLKFKDCAPKVFQKIRLAFGVTADDIMASFDFDNLIQVKGEGKSGAFLLISKDHRFILKTATMSERDYLWEILPYYMVYVKTRKETLLTRIFCVFSMKHEGIGGVTRFLIMGNVFNSNIYYDPIEKFDLKGSTSGRFVPAKLRGKVTTLKDQDMIDLDRKIYVPKSVRGELIEQLKQDSELLAKFAIMDYSLLIGIHYETETNKEDLLKRAKENALKPPALQSNTFYANKFQRQQGGIVGYNPVAKRREYYYLGIIDILMQYTARKKAEHFFRAIGGGGDELSTVPPGQYQQRFIDFMKNCIVEIDDSLIEDEPVVVADKEIQPKLNDSKSENRKSGDSKSGGKSDKIERATSKGTKNKDGVDSEPKTSPKATDSSQLNKSGDDNKPLKTRSEKPKPSDGGDSRKDKSTKAILSPRGGSSKKRDDKEVNKEAGGDRSPRSDRKKGEGDRSPRSGSSKRKDDKEVTKEKDNKDEVKKDEK